MKLKTEAELVVVGGIVLVIALWYAKKKAVEVGKEIVPYINPADSNNIVNQGVSWVGALISGQPNWSLGGSIYDATHGGSLDVTSENNLAYKGTNGIGAWLSGDDNFNLGSKIYDWTH